MKVIELNAPKSKLGGQQPVCDRFLVSHRDVSVAVVLGFGELQIVDLNVSGDLEFVNADSGARYMLMSRRKPVAVITGGKNLSIKRTMSGSTPPMRDTVLIERNGIVVGSILIADDIELSVANDAQGKAGRPPFERISLKRDGDEFAAVMGIEGLDAEQVDYGTSEGFWKFIAKSRTGKTIPLEQVKHRLAELDAKDGHSKLKSAEGRKRICGNMHRNGNRKSA